MAVPTPCTTHAQAPSLRHVHVYAHPASTQHGNTAMMLAAEKNRYLVIEALLAAHADPRAKNYARARHANRYRPHTARPPNVCTLRPWQCRLSPINAIPAPKPIDSPVGAGTSSGSPLGGSRTDEVPRADLRARGWRRTPNVSTKHPFPTFSNDPTC